MSSCSSSSSTQVQYISTTPVPTQPLLQVGLLRRQLQAELLEVRNQIARFRDQTAMLQWHDEMTPLIDDWQGRFSAALSTSADEETICQTYIGLLQELLRDPTTAPLDAYAVLGNDGHTYGQMSLAVYRLTPEYRNRSPLDAGNPRPFETTPHVVVRHMIGWLQRHNALLYSEELERRYLQLISQQQPIDRQTRIDRIAARQAALTQRDAQRRRMPNAELERSLDGRLRAWRAQVEQQVAPLMAPAAPTPQERGADALAEEARRRLDQIDLQDQQDIARVQARVDAMADRFEPAREQVENAAEEERQFHERLRGRVEDAIHEGLDRVAQRVDAYANEQVRTIDETARRNQEAMHQFEQTITQLHVEADELTRRNQALEKSQHDVAVQINEAQREAIDLQRGINETRIAIQEMKERSRNSLFSSIAIVGACIFATWAVHSVIGSTHFGISLPPRSGGAGIKFIIRM